MPTLNDYDKSDDSEGGLSEGFTPAQSNAVGQGPQQATPQKQQSDSYVPWSSFVNANQDVSQREAGKLAGQVQGDVSKAQGELSTDTQNFNQGIDSNYGQPSTPKQGAQKQQQGFSSEQNTPQAGPAVNAPTSQPKQKASTTNQNEAGGWSSLATPSTSQVPQTSAVTGGASNGMAARNAVAGAPASSAVTSQNPANAVTPTGRLSHPGPPSPAPVSANALASSLAPVQTGQQSQQRQSIGGWGYQGLNPGASAGSPKDLESTAGQAGWNQLLGDTLKASQEANALGSETGVQGLLQQQQTSPMQNTGFDAALINGQGAPQFQKLAQEYGGNQLGQNVINAEQASQDRWNQFAGDVNTRDQFNNAAQAPSVTSAATPSAAGATGQSGTSDQQAAYWNTTDSSGNTNLQNFFTDNSKGMMAVMEQMGINVTTDPSQPGYEDPNTYGGRFVSMLNGAYGDTGQIGQNAMQTFTAAKNALGLSDDALKTDLARMRGDEFQEFMVFGVVPQWMGGSGYPGEWQPPGMQQALNFGTDGGMWNAILNQWKGGAGAVASAIPAVGGIINAGIQSVPVNTSGNKYPNGKPKYT